MTAIKIAQLKNNGEDIEMNSHSHIRTHTNSHKGAYHDTPEHDLFTPEFIYAHLDSTDDILLSIYRYAVDRLHIVSRMSHNQIETFLGLQKDYWVYYLDEHCPDLVYNPDILPLVMMALLSLFNEADYGPDAYGEVGQVLIQAGVELNRD